MASYNHLILIMLDQIELNVRSRVSVRAAVVADPSHVEYRGGDLAVLPKEAEEFLGLIAAARTARGIRHWPRRVRRMASFDRGVRGRDRCLRRGYGSSVRGSGAVATRSAVRSSLMVHGLLEYISVCMQSKPASTSACVTYDASLGRSDYIQKRVGLTPRSDWDRIYVARAAGDAAVNDRRAWSAADRWVSNRAISSWHAGY